MIAFLISLLIIVIGFAVSNISSKQDEIDGLKRSERDSINFNKLHDTMREDPLLDRICSTWASATLRYFRACYHGTHGHSKIHNFDSKKIEDLLISNEGMSHEHAKPLSKIIMKILEEEKVFWDKK